MKRRQKRLSGRQLEALWFIKVNNDDPLLIITGELIAEMAHIPIGSIYRVLKDLRDHQWIYLTPLGYRLKQAPSPLFVKAVLKYLEEWWRVPKVREEIETWFERMKGSEQPGARQT
ncbi:hypothetical protein ACFLYO_10810 [Chloroflexota bacterium]